MQLFLDLFTTDYGLVALTVSEEHELVVQPIDSPVTTETA